MRRETYASGDKAAKAKDPTIKPRQTWRSINQHDFGTGLQDYSIRINFQDPFSKLWNCSYVLGMQMNSIVINNASLHVVMLSQEQIEKNFEFTPTPEATSPIVNAPFTITPNQPYVMPPNQWNLNPQYNQPIWITPQNIGGGFGFITTDNTGTPPPNFFGNVVGTYADQSNTYGLVSATLGAGDDDGYAAQGFSIGYR